MRDGSSGEGMQVWQILRAEGLEFAAVAPEAMGYCGGPREQKGPCRNCWGKGQGRVETSVSSRDPTPLSSPTLPNCRTGTPGLGLPPKLPSLGPLDCHGRWKIMEALLAGQPEG